MSSVSACLVITPRQACNQPWLSQILKAQRSGSSCLPYHLGLDPQSYRILLSRYLLVQRTQRDDARALQMERNLLREELLRMRIDEWQNLRQLLLANRASNDPEHGWMASIVAAGCLGGSHLWRDLGLHSRLDLRALLLHNFPPLVLRNRSDMRWKKFFYKQLCEQGEGHVCLAPSCEVCTTYSDCFGEEL
jgi:nitrogen fixation protein NifQ